MKHTYICKNNSSLCLNEQVATLTKMLRRDLSRWKRWKYALFTNILIVTISRITITKIRNFRHFDDIFTNILIVTVSRIAFTKIRNLRNFDAICIFRKRHGLTSCIQFALRKSLCLWQSGKLNIKSQHISGYAGLRSALNYF